MSISKFVSVICIAASVGACGSITRGTTEQITFVSEPGGAAMTTNKGYACPTTPCSLEIARSDEFVATFSKPGYRQATVNVQTKLVTTGAAGFAGNLLAGGVVGMGVDAYNGAAYDHYPNPVIAKMTPMSRPRPPMTPRRSTEPET